MDFTQWAYHPDKLPKEDTEKEKMLLELEDRFFEELKGRPEVQQWLEGYRPYDSKGYDTLLRYHVQHKRQLLKMAGYYLQKMDDLPEMRFRNECQLCLEAIQHKKLFDLQLQWRAEQLTLPDVRLAIDFDRIGRDILNCSFLDPISAADIALMKAFLETDEGAEWISWDSGESWQDYDAFFEEDRIGGNDEYPAWYAFYDDHRGTGALKTLPNIRGKKEAYYEDLGREVHQAREAEKRKNNPPVINPDQRPYLSYWGDHQKEMFQRFEDPYFRALFEFELKTRAEENEKNGDFDPFDDIHYLEQCMETAPMPAGLNWREALHLCMLRSVAQSVTNELDLAYAEYCMYRSTGISAPSSKKHEQDWLYRMTRNHILDGREAAGEPRDFNF